MKIKSESPWSVEDLSQFLWYCCPECEDRNQSKELFLEHAMIQHPDSQEYLKPLNVKDEPELLEESQEPEEPVVIDGKYMKLELEDLYSSNHLPLPDDENVPQTKGNDVDLHDTNGQSDYDYAPEDNYVEEEEEKDASYEQPAPKKPKRPKRDGPKYKCRRYKYYNCELCEETFRVLELLRVHEKEVHDTEITQPAAKANIGPFLCRICNEYLTTRIDLRNHDSFVHVKTNDNGEELYHCGVCDMYFGDDRMKLRNHGYIMHDGTGKAYKCPYCERSFGKDYLMARHVKSEHKEKSLECEFCGEGHKNVKDLKKHLEINHVGSSKGREYPCFYCELSFDNKKALKLHYQTIHNDKYSKCSQCGKRFPTEEALKSHKENDHDMKYPCPECGAMLSSSHGLDSHIKRVHQGIKQEKKHMCNKCGKTFHQQHYLFYHNKNMHENIKMCTCEVCGKSFACPSALKRHTRKIHDQEKNYHCDTCGKAFFTSSILKRHVDRVHLNIRKYHCHLCESKFKASIHLQTHIKLKHKIELSHAEVLAMNKKNETEDSKLL